MAQMKKKSWVDIINDGKSQTTHTLQKLGCITRLKLDMNFEGLKPRDFNKPKVLKVFQERAQHAEVVV